MARTDPQAVDAQALLLRAAAAELRADELQAWFDVLVETSAAGLGIISASENRYVRANEALADIFGLTVPQILAADPYELAQQLTHPDEIVAEQKLFGEVAVGARPFYRIDKRIRRPDGTMRWAQLTFSGINDEPVDGSASRPLRFAVVQLVDITDLKTSAETLKRREAELQHAQKIDGIGRLAAGIAHDFNNLLTVIMGHGEVLKDLAGRGRLSPPDLVEGLDAILEASTRAASLTAQVLSHGRRERITLSTFALSDVVATLQRLLGLTIGSHIRIEQTLRAEGSILADQGQVSQVVMNLILNARDAIAPGGHIALETRDLVVTGGGGRPGLGAWVVLEISDNGHGMSPEVRARIFEPFYTTRTERPGTQGTGLGLSTVHRIVTTVGGFIDVESTPAQGTTVTVYFPRVESDTPAAEAVRPEHAAAAPNSRRVLVVEDEASVRSLVAGVLLGAHYRVTVARDGDEALRLLDAEREPFNLIVTDLLMPGIDGLTVARRLHERGNHARVLFISGYSSHPPADLMAFGRLLTKPFTPAQLLETVRTVLGDP
jgi:PAS domain S-box-containing protein